MMYTGIVELTFQRDLTSRGYQVWQDALLFWMNEMGKTTEGTTIYINF